MDKQINTNMKIGHGVKAVRKMMDLTQEDFSSLIGITQGYLSQIETGAKSPNSEVLVMIEEKSPIPIGVIMWMAINESDVREDRRGMFKALKPSIDNLIKSVFTEVG